MLKRAKWCLMLENLFNNMVNEHIWNQIKSGINSFFVLKLCWNLISNISSLTWNINTI